MFQSKGRNGEPEPVFVLYLDTQKTGAPDKDTLYCAADATKLMTLKDPEEILGFIIPMLSELIYTVYGDPIKKTEPLTDWHTTGFDRNAVNGVKV